MNTVYSYLNKTSDNRDKRTILSCKFATNPFPLGSGLVGVTKGVRQDLGLVPNFFRGAPIRVFVKREEEVHQVAEGLQGS